jgi:colanic acid biosynthesis glycosyl transferase WcaI
VRLVVVTPHFSPDVAPTGDVVTRITEEFARRNHRIDVVTSLPWYREHKVEPGFRGRLIRYEDAPWGRIARVHPFPTGDKRNIARRAAAFAGFSVLTAFAGARGDPVDGVLALSPPLTLGLAGWRIARARRGAFVFNVQDVYPDVAVELGMLKNRLLITGASRLERFCYQRADLITVLSEDLRENIARRIPDASKIRVVPNFVDTQWIKPAPRSNAYRHELGLEDEFVVMYAGNVGLSQSLDLMIEGAAALAHDKDIAFVINGQGAMRVELEHRAASLPNIRFVDMQPTSRLPEVLAAGDVHVVPLRVGLARSSVPSKTYSILAAARPIIASVDGGSEVARVVEAAGAGIAVPPEDPEAFTKAVRALAEAPEAGRRMGAAGREWIESWASPGAVAEAYEGLFAELASRRNPRSGSR